MLKQEKNKENRGGQCIKMSHLGLTFNDAHLNIYLSHKPICWKKSKWCPDVLTHCNSSCQAKDEMFDSELTR